MAKRQIETTKVITESLGSLPYKTNALWLKTKIDEFLTKHNLVDCSLNFYVNDDDEEEFYLEGRVPKTEEEIQQEIDMIKEIEKRKKELAIQRKERKELKALEKMKKQYEELRKKLGIVDVGL